MKWYNYSNWYTLPVYFDDLPNDNEWEEYGRREYLKNKLSTDNWFWVFMELAQGIKKRELLNNWKNISLTEEVCLAAEYLWNMLKKWMIKVQVSNIEHRNIHGLWEGLIIGTNIILYTQLHEVDNMIEDVKGRWDKIMDRHKKLITLIPPGVTFPNAGYENPDTEIWDFWAYGVLVSHPDDSFCVLLDINEAREARARYENSQK